MEELDEDTLYNIQESNHHPANPVPPTAPAADAEQDPETQRKSYSVIIGDSNTRGLNLREDLPIQIIPQSVGGTTVQDVEKRMTQIQVSPLEVMVAVLHVGTCNWKATNKEVISGDTVYTQYIEALNEVTNKFPHAELVVSSVPLRDRRHPEERNEKINLEITRLNTKLQALGDSESNITYIDNNEGLTIGNVPDSSLYTRADFLGVHLNEKGRMILADNISSGIQETYHRAAMREEWSIME